MISTVSRRRRRAAAVIACMIGAAACSDGSTSGGSGSPVDGEVSSDVLAALKAAAEGRSFEDDLDAATMKTGGPLSSMQRAFDVRRYDLSVRVMPATRTIEGQVAVTFAALEDLGAIELNLDPRLAVTGATLDGAALETARDGNRAVINLPERLETGARATVVVSFGGKPHIALAPPWHGGLVWSEVDGTPS